MTGGDRLRKLLCLSQCACLVVASAGVVHAIGRRIPAVPISTAACRRIAAVCQSKETLKDHQPATSASLILRNQRWKGQWHGALRGRRSFRYIANPRVASLRGQIQLITLAWADIDHNGPGGGVDIYELE